MRGEDGFDGVRTYDGSNGVFVKWIIPDAEDAGEDGGFVLFGFSRGRVAGVKLRGVQGCYAIVHARFYIWVRG